MITAIVAIDDLRGIANNSGIPWDIPRDRRYFKQKTLNNTVIMGYKTYKALDACLPQRKNIVLSSHKLMRKGFLLCSSVNEALDLVEGDLYVIGGQDVYRLFLPYTQRLIITRVLGDYSCTRFFPEYSNEFTLTFRSKKYKHGNYNYWYEHWNRC